MTTPILTGKRWISKFEEVLGDNAEALLLIGDLLEAIPDFKNINDTHIVVPNEENMVNEQLDSTETIFIFESYFDVPELSHYRYYSYRTARGRHPLLELDIKNMISAIQAQFKSRCIFYRRVGRFARKRVHSEVFKELMLLVNEHKVGLESIVTKLVAKDVAKCTSTYMRVVKMHIEAHGYTHANARLAIKGTAPSGPAPVQTPLDLKPDYVQDILSDKEILKIASDPSVTPVFPYQLDGTVTIGVIMEQVLRFARAIIEAQSKKKSPPN